MSRGHCIIPTPVVTNLYAEQDGSSSNSLRSNSPNHGELIAPPPDTKPSPNHDLQSLRSILRNGKRYTSLRNNVKKHNDGEVGFPSQPHDDSVLYSRSRDPNAGPNEKDDYVYCGEQYSVQQTEPWENIPGAVLQTHNAELLVKVFNPESQSNDDKTVTIYMTHQENNPANSTNQTAPDSRTQYAVLDIQSLEPPKITPRRSKVKKIESSSQITEQNNFINDINCSLSASKNTSIEIRVTDHSRRNSNVIDDSCSNTGSCCCENEGVRNRYENVVNTTHAIAAEEAEPSETSATESRDNTEPEDHGCYPQVSSVGIQVSPSPQYRLRFLPICGCTRIDESEWQFCGKEGLYFLLRLAGRWIFSQCGLGVILVAWALLGAAAFRATEGPREEQQMVELHKAQQVLVVELATELRLVKPEQSIWKETIQKYVAQHEETLLEAVSSGYGEGGGRGKIWSYAGCLLFAVSLLTTLGFGAPVPRTTLGRLAAVVFSAVGIPLHLLLVLNIGMLVAVKLQGLALCWQSGTSLPSAVLQCCYTYKGGKTLSSPQMKQNYQESNMSRSAHQESESRRCNIVSGPFVAPRWLKWLPAVSLLTYYTAGVLVFGVGRSRPISACLLFPLDFTAAGGVGLTGGPIRTCYALYLEGAVTLAAICVAVLQVSAGKGMTELGLKLGLLTNS